MIGGEAPPFAPVARKDAAWSKLVVVILPSFVQCDPARSASPRLSRRPMSPGEYSGRKPPDSRSPHAHPLQLSCRPYLRQLDQRAHVRDATNEPPRRSVVTGPLRPDS